MAHVDIAYIIVAYLVMTYVAMADFVIAMAYCIRLSPM